MCKKIKFIVKRSNENTEVKKGSNKCEFKYMHDFNLLSSSRINYLFVILFAIYINIKREGKRKIYFTMQVVRELSRYQFCDQ